MVATVFSHGAPRAMFAIVGLGLIACVQILALSLTGWVTSGVSLSLTSSPVKGIMLVPVVRAAVGIRRHDGCESEPERTEHSSCPLSGSSCRC